MLCKYLQTHIEGWGAHLDEQTARGTWSLLGSKLHINYLGLKAVFLALKEFQVLCSNKIVLAATDNTTVVSYINKKGGMRSGPLCALLWRILTWCTRKQVTLKPTHSRPAEPGSRQAIQARPHHSNRVVSPSRGLPLNMQQVAPAQNRLICHEVQQQVASVCVTSTGSPGHSSGCAQSTMVGSGRIHLRTNSHLGQSGGEDTGHHMQENHSDCPRVAQHALVLGSGGHVQSNPTKPARCAQSIDTALQSEPSQKSDKPKSPCMAPTASAIKE